MQPVKFRAFDVVRYYRDFKNKTLLYCGYCGQSMAAVFEYANNFYMTDLSYRYTCPHCGRGHTDDRTVGNLTQTRSAVPLDVELWVKEYKDFVDLNIKYTAVMYNDGYDDLFKGLQPRFETIRFDCKHRRVIRRFKIGARSRFIDTPIDAADVPTIARVGLSQTIFSTLNGESNAGKHRRECQAVMSALRKAVVSRLEKYAGYPIKYTHHAINTRGTQFFGDDVLRRLILKTYAPDAPLNVVDTKLRNNTIMPHTWETYRAVFYDTQKGKSYIDAVEDKLVKQPSKAKRVAIMRDARYIEAIHIAEGLTDNKDYQDALMEAIRPYLGMEYLYRYLADYVANKSPRNALQFLARYEYQREAWRMIADTARSYEDIIDKEAVWRQKIKPADMHDVLAKIVRKERDKDIPLNPDGELEAHINGYDFIMPKTSHELIDLGEAMRNCVGSYKKRVAQGKCAIVDCTKDGKPVVCIEIQHGLIMQAKLFDNKSVRSSASEEVKSAIYQYMDVKGLRDMSGDLRS